MLKGLRVYFKWKESGLLGAFRLLLGAKIHKKIEKSAPKGKNFQLSTFNFQLFCTFAP